MVLVREDTEALMLDATGGPGDPERRRVVVGRDFPFLKKGTLMLSVVDIVVSEQQANQTDLSRAHDGGPRLA